MREEKTPIDRVIGALGGASIVAEVIGVSRSYITKIKKRSCLVPSKYQRKILKYAAENHLDLCAWDVIEREGDEVEKQG